jgi:hypothetical protein
MLVTGTELGLGPGALLGPVRRGTRAVLEFGDLFFEVDPEVGGRVTSARVAGRELLVGPTVHPQNYGSTFWTSPQNGPFGWGWPPVTAIDSVPFALRELSLGFEVEGPAVSAPELPAIDGLSVQKRFVANPERRSLEITYSIANRSQRAKRVAPWEITRVGPLGLSFYASDEAPTGELPLPTTREAGCVWFQHSGQAPPHGKLFGDGSGWLAHLTPERVLLVRAFDEPRRDLVAPNEAEIEIYSSPQPTPAEAYVELENQGEFREIAAGSSISWRSIWYLRALPPALPLAPAASLVDLVQQTLG